MINRRTFIIKSAAISAAIPLQKLTSQINIEKGLKPIVLSTWNFGQMANAAAWEILISGGKSIDAVEAGVKIPEGDPEISSVGYGGRPDRDGFVTLDSCIMDEKGNCGAVSFLQHIKHPVSVARLIMEKTPHIMLSGDGALQFALQNGFKKENLLTEEAENDWKQWLKSSDYKPVINIENHDTIGMLAMDENGNLSGACTTSGIAYKMHGRVGDSPIIGAGLYVDNEIGAATATGLGEEVIRICGSHLIVELMRQGYTPIDACKEAVNRIISKSPSDVKNIQVGFLALNKQGEFGSYAIHQGFQYAVYSKEHQNILKMAKSYY